ncbi:MAG: Lrp/AsnC ligand binding domain-containing protein [Chloroflexi bacterium]|nr:Lrp/AsnC ligand binding domain-containing protein [Chloroflexota bacterium]
MAASAYILVTVDPAQTQRVVERLRAIPGALVKEVLGPYDVVVELEADSAERITWTLREKIRPVPGVTSTVTCMVM